MEICQKCEDTHDFNYGIKGKNADQTRLMMVLHHSDMRATVPALPCFDSYELALWKSATGKGIQDMLYFCGLFPDDAYITNFIKCLFDRPLKSSDYLNCQNMLLRQIEEFEPKAVMIFGQKPAEHLFSSKTLKDVLYNENEKYGRPLKAFNHPSAPWLRSGRLKQRECGEAKRFLEKTGII